MVQTRAEAAKMAGGREADFRAAPSSQCNRLLVVNGGIVAQDPYKARPRLARTTTTATKGAGQRAKSISPATATSVPPAAAPPQPPPGDLGLPSSLGEKRVTRNGKIYGFEQVAQDFGASAFDAPSSQAIKETGQQILEHVRSEGYGVFRGIVPEMAAELGNDLAREWADDPHAPSKDITIFPHGKDNAIGAEGTIGRLIHPKKIAERYLSRSAKFLTLIRVLAQGLPWAATLGYRVLLCVTAARKKKGNTKIHTDQAYVVHNEGFIQGATHHQDKDYDQHTACRECDQGAGKIGKKGEWMICYECGSRYHVTCLYPQQDVQPEPSTVQTALGEQDSWTCAQCGPQPVVFTCWLPLVPLTLHGGLAFLASSRQLHHQPKHDQDHLPRGFWAKTKQKIWKWGHWAVGDMSIHLKSTAHGTTSPPKGFTRWAMEFRLVIVSLRADDNNATNTTPQRRYINDQSTTCVELLRQPPATMAAVPAAPTMTASSPVTPRPTKRRRTTRK